ncbi:MAG TPA: sigma-54 dependent transcriptional regulator, partial [Micavibrio sp.]
MSHNPYKDLPPSSFSVDHDMAGYQSATEGLSDPARAHRPPYQAPPLASFIGTSAVMQQSYGQIERAAQSAAPVFIMGETGTGKEVCAEAIHRHSPRAQQPFIAINCAAIPRDLLESELFGHVKGAFTGAINDREGAAALAHKGTLFLDEVAEMAPDMQTKLLRFLQNFTFRKVGGNGLEKTDVRIICATNRDPLHEISAGHLRQDLYFRLHVIPLQMPRLQERAEDVLDIAYALMRRYSREERKKFSALSPAVQQFFRQYDWPGNVRQLQNVLR